MEQQHFQPTSGEKNDEKQQPVISIFNIMQHQPWWWAQTSGAGLTWFLHKSCDCTATSGLMRFLHNAEKFLCLSAFCQMVTHCTPMLLKTARAVVQKPGESLGGTMKTFCRIGWLCRDLILFLQWQTRLWTKCMSMLLCNRCLHWSQSKHHCCIVIEMQPGWHQRF